jgi:hypothetical protein
MTDEAVSPNLDEQQKVIAWNVLMLLDLGFSLDQAQLLTSMRYFDWHAAEYLRERGCSHELVIEILT